MQSLATPVPWKVVEYDAFRRRLWILGQRCHHGSTGALVAAVGCVGMIIKPRVALALTAAGGALMAHDWQDHSFWFELGRGSQP
jgi:hypothetical protein